MMVEDDMPVGRLLGRREALRVVGGASAWLLAGAGLRAGAALATVPSTVCVARPKQTEGPYFVDEGLQRSDIRADPDSGLVKAGVPLALSFFVSQLGTDACRPLPGAQVDLWHCDALGVYSDVRDANFDTTGQRFLRGYQVTDERGQAQFTTIFPGWYPGRTVHFHFKIRTGSAARNRYEFTSQLYFDDALIDRIHATPAYASKGSRTSRNNDDRIFRRSGEQLLLAPVETATGYAASFAIGLQLS